jgi:hypothetical protein
MAMMTFRMLGPSRPTMPSASNTPGKANTTSSTREIRSSRGRPYRPATIPSAAPRTRARATELALT